MRELERTRSESSEPTSVITTAPRFAPTRESVAAMDGRRARQRVWPEWFDSDVASKRAPTVDDDVDRYAAATSRWRALVLVEASRWSGAAVRENPRH